MAVLAPMPSARVRTATTVKPGLRRKRRKAWRRSRRRLVILIPQHDKTSETSKGSVGCEILRMMGAGCNKKGHDISCPYAGYWRNPTEIDELERHGKLRTGTGLGRGLRGSISSRLAVR